MDMIIRPVTLPPDSPLARRPVGDKVIDATGMSRFDHKTVFYDVFIDQESQQLIAIGPPMFNLADAFKRMTLRIDGKRVQYRWSEYAENKISLLTAPLPNPGRHEVHFAFPDFSTILALEAPRDKPLAGKTTLVTVSKDNEISWISDWVDFYRHNYGVDEVVIYDNGSQNVESLEQAMAGRAHIVRWNFRYGPPSNSHNSFAQPGALNHFIRRFATRGVMFNFDIDEFLIAKRETLFSELKHKGTLYIESYLMPFVPKEGKQQPHYCHYDFVYREPGIKKSGKKFICDIERVDIISQHNTWNFKRHGFFKRLTRNKVDTHRSEQAYFLHILGITTNWKPEQGKLKEVSREGLVFDDSHIRRRP